MLKTQEWLRRPELKHPARRMTFRRQLSLVVAVGVLLLAVLSSFVSAWQGNVQLQDNLREQGLRIASSLASQSALALLSGAPDNAGQAVSAALAFPDVMRVEIFNADGTVLLSNGSQPGQQALPMQVKPVPHDAFQEDEDDASWHFVAPVWSHRAENPFDTEKPTDTYLGFVRVVYSKATLQRLTAHVIYGNLVISSVLAVIFLVVIRWWSMRLMQPLKDLSAVMALAERGDVSARAETQGPQDIVAMSQAFNRMMAALQERTDDLHRHQGQLEELVKERTVELIAARDRAEEANRAKSTFLARMSHELRTPLNAIMGYAQLLKIGGALSERQAVGVNTIHSSGEHLLMLINDILDLSSIEAGKFQLYVRPMSAKEFFQGIVDIMSIRAAEKGIEFHLRVAEDLPEVLNADEKRLRQVLLNLLSNAVKFTQQGGVRLSVSVCSVSPRRGYRLRFEVADSGVGLAPEDLDRIFEPFEQAGDGTSRIGGTGLGLAISRQLVRMMGGEIRVESQLGSGSLFWFDLWLTGQAAADELGADDDEQHFDDVIGYEGRRRILVVDDVVANRRMLADWLEPLGFDVEMAVDGVDAMVRVTERAPDLILMDIVMPEMDGLTAIEHIRRKPEWMDLPVIALSANASMADREHALNAGADVFLPKPLERDALLMQIGRCLSLVWRRTP